MTEAQVGFLYNIADAISQSQDNESKTLLKSYYLMRCKDITRGYGLPEKHFSSKIRCPKCCIEWKKDTEIKVRSIRLSKRQKHRLKSSQITKSKKAYIRRRKDLLSSNEIEQICSFCKNSTVTPVMKPNKQITNDSIDKDDIAPEKDLNAAVKQKVNQKINKKAENLANSNVYANALDIFSLKNKNNTLASTVKEKPKVILNSKKKKDRFAGLCQQAVLASAKLKEEKKKQNNLNLFLKPSI